MPLLQCGNGLAAAGWRCRRREGIFALRPSPFALRMLLVTLDPYLLGDPLFLTQLARDLAHRGGGAVLVHGSGEAGERALEATGAVARQLDGVWAVASEEEAHVVERATRELNRQIVHELNEAGVSAIRVLGADRGLLKRDGATVLAGATEWLDELASQGVVAVVAAVVAPTEGGGALREIDRLEASAALARAASGARVRVMTAGSDREGAGRQIEALERLGVDASALAPGALRGLE